MQEPTVLHRTVFAEIREVTEVKSTVTAAFFGKGACPTADGECIAQAESLLSGGDRLALTKARVPGTYRAGHRRGRSPPEGAPEIDTVFSLPSS